jgi:TolA-binding protein
MKKLNVTREQALRWAAQGMMAILVLVAAFAVTQYLKVSELESSASAEKAESQKASQDAAAARKKMQDELKAVNARAAELEGKQRETDNMKALLAKLEPQIAPVLEAAGKAGKPDVRAAALAGVGLIGQITHGANHGAALGALDRALALDKGNCVAGLAANLSSTKKVEVAPDCKALLPGPAAEAAAAPKPAADAKPAVDARPAPEAAAVAKPAAVPTGGAGKAAEPAAKK